MLLLKSKSLVINQAFKTNMLVVIIYLFILTKT